MGYFSNGTQGMDYQERYCSRCVHDGKCAVWFAHMHHNYDYDAFADGSKREELRLYGPRWNERTCAVGREVVLSKGYGKKSRMIGNIWKFRRQHGTTFGSTDKDAIRVCYGTLDVWIAHISVTDLRPNNN